MTKEQIEEERERITALKVRGNGTVIQAVECSKAVALFEIAYQLAVMNERERD